MTFWEFWNHHTFLAWCALWSLWGFVVIALIAMTLTNRFIRSINILIRGWPPAHIDADGDGIASKTPSKQ